MGYFILAFVALSPMYLPSLGGWQNFTTIVFSLSFGIIAMVSLLRHEDFKYSRRLLDEQNGQLKKIENFE